MTRPLRTHSKLLSLILRHDPAKAGLTLGEGGWVQIDDLLAGLETLDSPMTRAQLDQIVELNDKKRFTISEDGKQIRAAQGHSVKVDMQYVPTTPPDALFHGTATRFLEPILNEGLKSMARQHVHLSLDVETATRVGQRHGKPVILRINSKQMSADGHQFFQAENGVWLTEAVPTNYLEQFSSEES